MSLSVLSILLASVRTQAAASRKEVTRLADDTERSAKRVAESLPAMRLAITAHGEIIEGAEADMEEMLANQEIQLGRVKRIGREAEEEYQELIKRLRDRGGDIASYFGKELEDFVPNQRELIEQIENTAFGLNLDAWAKTYIELQRTDLSARIRDDLGKQMTAYEGVIRKLTGPAGQIFNFHTLRQDIDDVLKRLRDGLTQVEDVGRNTKARGPTSGTLGKSPDKCCGGASSSLNLLLQSGALR